MNNQKGPDSDGFTTEFYKFFLEGHRTPFGQIY